MMSRGWPRTLKRLDAHMIRRFQGARPSRTARTAPSLNSCIRTPQNERIIGISRHLTQARGSDPSHLAGTLMHLRPDWQNRAHVSHVLSSHSLSLHPRQNYRTLKGRSEVKSTPAGHGAAPAGRPQPGPPAAARTAPAPSGTDSPCLRAAGTTSVQLRHALASGARSAPLNTLPYQALLERSAEQGTIVGSDHTPQENTTEPQSSLHFPECWRHSPEYWMRVS